MNNNYDMTAYMLWFPSLGAFLMKRKNAQRRYTYGIISGFLLHVTFAALLIILNTHSAFKNGDFVMI